jgi:hypothetical protein
MPSDWIPNCGTQLERAIRALFIAEGAATADDCHISNDSTERTGLITTGLTTILASQSTAADTELSGNEKWSVSIQNKFGAALQPGETNASVNRVALDTRVGKQMLEMMQSSGNPSGSLDETAANITAAGRALAAVDDETAAANDVDMTEFTCLFVRYLGSTRGRPDDGSCAWVEVRNFEITACPSNVD